MVAMAVSVTAIFINSLWGTPRLLFDAIRSVGQGIEEAIDQLSLEIDAIVVDEAAASVADRVDRLADLRARHMTAS